MRGFRLPGNSGSPDMSLWRCLSQEKTPGRSGMHREQPRHTSGGLVTHPRASLLRLN